MMMVVAALSKRIENLDGPTWEKMLLYYTFLVVPELCFVIDKGCCRLGVNIWKFETHELAALL